MQEPHHQADVPTQEGVPAKDPWVSRAYGLTGRAQRHHGAAPQGAQAFDPRTSPHPLSRGSSLRGRNRFAAVRRNGGEGRSQGIRVTASANGLPMSRLGIAAPRMPGAVQRNRVRRRIREASRCTLSSRPGFDLIIIAGLATLSLSFAELRQAIAEAAARAVSHAEARTSCATAHNGHSRSPASVAPDRELIP